MFRLFVSLFLSAWALSAQADVHLLTSIKPLQLIAAAVQEGAGQPDVLLPPGASPHQYALRPSDVRRVREADLLYWVGPIWRGSCPASCRAATSPVSLCRMCPA